MPPLSVSLIFRARNDSSFSIENVFGSIIPYLRKCVNVSCFNVPIRKAGIKALFQNIYAAKKIHGDIFHITGDIHYLVFAYPRRKTILTIHDAVFLENTRGFKKYLMKKLWLQWPVFYSARVTTISEKSKSEIVFHTGCNPSKVLVIPNPVSDLIITEKRLFNKTNPIILFVGTKPNKNILRVIKALESVPCTLHIIGKLSKEQINALEESKICFRSSQNLSDSQMAVAYQQSDIILFPSLYEGFGLPIIEGQKAGRPVITSNISPLSDIAGGAAHLVNPLDHLSIRKGVQKVIDDNEYRESLCVAGLKNVKKYSSEKIAEAYLELYKIEFQRLNPKERINECN